MKKRLFKSICGLAVTVLIIGAGSGGVMASDLLAQSGDYKQVYAAADVDKTLLKMEFHQRQLAHDALLIVAEDKEIGSSVILAKIGGVGLEHKRDRIQRPVSFIQRLKSSQMYIAFFGRQHKPPNLS